jgi:hypothetical protein
MKIRARFNHWLPRLLGIYGITLYPWVLFSVPMWEAINSSLLAHEAIHVRQIRSVGWFYFYWTYFVDYLRARLAGKSDDDAYLSIPYEVEAYADELRIELSEAELREFGVWPLGK